MRPGLVPLDARVARLEAAAAATTNLTERINERVTDIAGTLARRGVITDQAAAQKYQSELAFWRAFVKQGLDIRHYGEPYGSLFAKWQRSRIEELGQALGLDPGVRTEEGPGGVPVEAAEIDRWCRGKSVVEIGAGPYPAICAARLGWARAVAADPVAKGYCEEGMVPAACGSVVYIEAPGECVPLPAGFADLVIIENCLDHVADPKAVVCEIHRLLQPGGLVWLFVDLSEYADAMHPHPMSEAGVLALMGAFQLIRGGRAVNKAHPEAYGAYRGLWRKPAVLQAPAPVVRAVQSVSHAAP